MKALMDGMGKRDVLYCLYNQPGSRPGEGRIWECF